MIEFVVLMLATITDALRDRWINRREDIGWWRWHIVKWLNFFSLAGYVFFRADFSPCLGFLFIFFCWVLWNVIYWRGRFIL